MQQPAEKTPLHLTLTFAVVSQGHDGTAANDAAHGVCVLDVALEDLVVVEHACGQVLHLVRVNKPGTVEPRVMAVKAGE